MAGSRFDSFDPRCKVVVLQVVVACDGGRGGGPMNGRGNMGGGAKQRLSPEGAGFIPQGKDYHEIIRIQ